MRTLLIWILLAAGCAAHAQETIKPGYWESTDKVLSPFPSTKLDRRCVTAQAVKKFMSCYINHHYTCDCPDQSYADGQIRFRGTCVDNKGAHVKVAGTGSYTTTTLHMDAEVVAKLGGLPIQIKASTDARRLGDVCPADSTQK